MGSVVFGMTKFSREEERLVTVCNESQHEVQISGQFYTEPPVAVNQEDSDSFDKEETLSNKLIDEAVSMHSVLLYDFEERTSVQDVRIDAEAVKHFDSVVPNRISAGVSTEIKLVFRPSYDADNPFPDDVEPPYFQRTKITFCFSDAEDCSVFVCLLLRTRVVFSVCSITKYFVAFCFLVFPAFPPVSTLCDRHFKMWQSALFGKP